MEAANKLNVIVPVRDRDEDLALTVTSLRTIFAAQGIDYRFWIIEQKSRTDPFNKGTLINVGFIKSRKQPFSDYYLINDADIFPKQPHTIEYSLNNGVTHYYGMRHCLGGFFTIHRNLYQQVNGFSNAFWGWGWEDVEFQGRIESMGIVIDRSQFSDRFQSNDVFDRQDPGGFAKSNKQHKHLAMEKIARYKLNPALVRQDGLVQTKFTESGIETVNGINDICKHIVDIPFRE